MSQGISKAASKPRIRTFHNKSRDGCRPCKDRRVKCDEGHPICLRCRRNDRECVRDTDSLLALHRPRNRKSEDPSGSQGAFTTDDGTSAAELEYFIRNTLPYMRQSRSSPVWDHMIRLLRQNNPVIGKVAAAISHQQRALEDEPPDDASYASAAAYSAAIRAQSQSLSEFEGNDHAVHAISCLLLIVLESLRGSCANLELHLKPCVYILQDQRSQGQETAEILDQVALLIESYILSSVGFSPIAMHASRARQLLQTIWACRPHADEVVRIERSLVEEMVTTLDAWTTAAQSGHALPVCDPDVAAVKLRATEVQEMALNEAAENYIEAAQGDARSKAYCGFAVARSLLAISLIRTLTGVPIPQAATLATYQRMVDVCEDSLAQLRIHESGCAADAPNAFSIGLGAIAVLYSVGTRCKDFCVRRRALLVLETCPRREGIWTVEMARFRVVAVIKAEEERASQRYPEGLPNNYLPEDCQVRHDEILEIDGKPVLRLFWRDRNSRSFTIEDIPVVPCQSICPFELSSSSIDAFPDPAAPVL